MVLEHSCQFSFYLFLGTGVPRISNKFPLSVSRPINLFNMSYNVLLFTIPLFRPYLISRYHLRSTLKFTH